LRFAGFGAEQSPARKAKQIAEAVKAFQAADPRGGSKVGDARAHLSIEGFQGTRVGMWTSE
jgi:hypothetical protein